MSTSAITGDTFHKVASKKRVNFPRKHLPYKARAKKIIKDSKIQPPCTTVKETFEGPRSKVESNSTKSTGLDTQIQNSNQASSLGACDYEVEGILGHRIRLDTGNPEFLLKWKGYSDEENSWEPSSNLDGCPNTLHMYIIRKVLPAYPEPKLRKMFTDLLPINLRKRELSRESKEDSRSLRHPKKSLVKAVEKPATTSKAAKNDNAGTPQVERRKKVTSNKKQRPSESKMKATSAGLKQQTSTTTSPVVVTLGRSRSESTESSSENSVAKSSLASGKLLQDENKQKSKEIKSSNSVIVNRNISTNKAVNQTQHDSLQCTKEISDQENTDEHGIPDSRSHSVESLKECSLHCNGVLVADSEPILILKYIPPSSPVLHFSPEPPEEGPKRSHTNHRSFDSPLDDFELQLNISRSPTPVSTELNSFTFNSKEIGNHLDSDRNMSGAPSHSISVSDSPVSHTLSISDDASTLTDCSRSPASDTMDSSASCIPVFLLHKQKVFSTPMPLPRSKSKRSWAQPVPTKAAKRNQSLSSHVPKHLKKQPVTSNIPLTSVANNRVPHDVIDLTTNDARHQIPPPQLTGFQSSPEPLASNENNQSPTCLSTPPYSLTQPSRHSLFSPTMTRRPIESAAVLLYRESLLNWQHQLNKQRDGTDEFILVENEVDRATPPFYFKYISSNHYVTGVPNPSDPEVSGSLCGCECYVLGKKCGSKSSLCCPKMANAEFAYSKAGKVQVEPGTPIYECNSKCSCPADCVNRVVQHGRKVPLCIFRTVDGRGWGVKTVQPIKAHTFITEYVGEIITSEEAERRGCYYDQLGSTYLFDLDFDDDNSEFTIDAAREGNISHFFNHSCQPNLVVYSVWIESLDKRLPRIAFFTTRNVSAGEELTFDYQMNHDQNTPSPISSRQKLRMKCLCRSQKCLGYYW